MFKFFRRLICKYFGHKKSARLAFTYCSRCGLLLFHHLPDAIIARVAASYSNGRFPGIQL